MNIDGNKDTVNPELPDFPDSPARPGYSRHQRSSSSLSNLSELTLLELERSNDDEFQIEVVAAPDEKTEIPLSTLVVVTETDKVEGQDTILGDISLSKLDFSLEESKFRVRDWDGKKGYSDYIMDGLKYKDKGDTNVVMLFESPSCSTSGSSFHNKSKFRFHDWPPSKSVKAKGVLGPCRYASMNGSSFPLFLRDGKPPAGLVEHWAETIPDYTPSTYIDKITDDETVYAYLPVEQIRNHLNDPESKWN